MLLLNLVHEVNQLLTLLGKLEAQKGVLHHEIERGLVRGIEDPLIDALGVVELKWRVKGGRLSDEARRGNAPYP